MITASLIFAALAAALHVYIFYMESIAWTSKRVRATFGTTEAEAAATREMAFNQGFYNLFLAIITGIGIVCVLIGELGAGTALVFAGTGSMLAAALVLWVTSPDKRRAAATQGLFPLLSVLLLVGGMLLEG
ncbi:DUF1304 domain-containing protein [Leucobacter sp. GX24907]